MTMRELDHVERFLWHVDSRGRFLKLAEFLSEGALEDPQIRENLSAIRVWAEKQSEQIGGPGIGSGVLGSPVEATLLAVSYLRAEAGLQARAAGVPSTLEELKKAVADARKLVDGLEPDFVSELLLETERRASRDPAFEHRLSEGRADVRWLAGQMHSLAAPSIHKTVQSAAPARTAATSSKTVDRGTLILVGCIILGLVLGGVGRKVGD
jgi:hypothetical protein